MMVSAAPSFDFYDLDNLNYFSHKGNNYLMNKIISNLVP